MAEIPELRVGTSGFSYPAWKGSFYPADARPGDLLGLYAERLRAVEINNTFYRLPRPSVLETWAAAVPEGFRFAIKASRRITHFKRLKDPGDETDYLLESVRVLGDRLGALLFQLPPNLPADLPRLEAFVRRIPEGLPAAFEFRHPTWDDAGVERLLADRDFARVLVDSDDRPASAAAGGSPRWGYVRLRRDAYGGPDLAGWAERLRASGWERGFAFFKHEVEGPSLAVALQALVDRSPARARPASRRGRRASG